MIYASDDPIIRISKRSTMSDLLWISTMNIGTHFVYNNHIVPVSTNTKIGTPREKAPIPQILSAMEENLLIQLFECSG